MKKFFKKTEGFTLVELIVVIAILGILAGVGTVGYSGYIKKANQAADQQLVAAVNQAFAAACLENYVDASTLADNSVRATVSAKKVTGVDKFNEDFLKYFGENVNAEFKEATGLNFEGGMFVANFDEGSTGGVFSTIFENLGASIEDSTKKVQDSTFGDIGATELMNKVDTVTGLASALAGVSPAFYNVLDANIPSMAVAMGYTLGEDGQPGEDFWTDYIAMVERKIAEVYPGETVEAGSAKYNAVSNQILSNYAVLQAAKSTTGTAADLLADLQSGISVQEVKSLMSIDASVDSTQAGLSKAAMMYAMYTAYANGLDADNPDKTAAMENAGDVTKFLGAMTNAQNNPDTDGFMAYLRNTESTAKADLEGYLGALDIIEKSANSNSEAVTDLLYNGYTDPDLVAALNSLLGK